MAATPPPGHPVVDLEGIDKSYGPVVALRGVGLRLMPGEVHCLAGENGAGKSTLIKVLTGAEQRDAGVYRVAGEPMAASVSPAEARAAGVGVVYQELSLLPHLSIADNLLMGRLPSRWGLVRRQRRAELAREYLARVGLESLDPDTEVAELPTAGRQLVEIARVLGLDARLVIFDEPTTALAEAEAEELLRRIGDLADQGIAVLYVTHRIEEMFRIGHHVTVLRDGEVTQTRAVADLTPQALVESMVGRSVDALYPDVPAPEERPRLEVRDLGIPGFAAPVDLTVRRGEILGLAGLMGAGRTELLRAVFGADPTTAGQVLVDGAPVARNATRGSAAAGVGLLTEDRKESGLLEHLSIQDNVGLASYAALGRRGYLAPAWVRERALAATDGLGVKYRDLQDPVTSLSGGNQQKALLARWLARDARVLLLDEPTKGVDVGAKADIYQVIAELAAQGLAVVVVSSYLPELLGLCHRIAVLREGRLVADLDPARTTEAEIAHFASLGSDPADTEGETAMAVATDEAGAADAADEGVSNGHGSE